MRHLIFWAVVGAALAPAFTLLSPAVEPLRSERREARRGLPPDTRASVERLDASFAAWWHDHHVEPVAAADEYTVVRRLALALMGTIPSLEEIRQLQQLPAAERVDVYLAKTLADRRSSDYLAERLARAFVGTKDGAFIAYRRRRFVSWLGDELHAGTHYDRIVRQLITTNGWGTDHPAANFILATMKPDTGKQLEPVPNELAGRVARALLAARIDCAECHDHPFEPWKQADFQALAAFFGQTRYSYQGVHDVEERYRVEDRMTGKLVSLTPRAPYHDEWRPKDEAWREQLAAWITAPENDRFSLAIVNRIWGLMFGQGLIEPIDDIRRAEQAPPMLRELADDFRQHDYDLQRLIRVIAASRVFRLDSRSPVDESTSTTTAETQNDAELWTRYPLSRLRAEQMAGSVVQAASLTTIDRQATLLERFAKTIEQGDFIRQYGDAGEDELTDRDGTLPQQLLLMNGKLVREKTRQNYLLNAATQIASLAKDDDQRIDLIYLTVLTRMPSDEEREHFVDRLAHRTKVNRNERLGDIAWSLINSTEFSWNH